MNTEDGPLASDTVTYTYNYARLRSGLSLQPTGSWTNGFTYDAARRLSAVTSPASTFSLAYRDSQPLATKNINPRHNAHGIRFHALEATAGFFLETPLNGLLARCGSSMLRSMMSEIGPRRWRLGLFVGALGLGHCRRLVWAGPLARVTPSNQRTRQVHVKNVVLFTNRRCSILENSALR